MLLRRRMYGKSGGSIPYQRIEYLESSGTQWIDTGLKGNLLTKIDVEFSITQLTFNGIVGDNTNTSSAISVFANSGSTYQRFGSKSIVIANWAINTKYTVSTNKDIYKRNDSSYSFPQQLDFTTQNNLCIFRITSSIYSRARVYSLSIWNDDSLVRDFVPVRIGQVGYMYDTVSGELFGNAGTGDFILGSDIN